MNHFETKVSFYCADQNPQRDRSRGITAYSVNLMRALQCRGVRVEAVVSKSSFAVPAGVPSVELPFRTDHAPGRLIGDHFHPLFTRGKGKDRRLWHYPKGFLPFHWQVDGPKVGTIADLILDFYATKYPASRHRLAFAYWLGVLRRSMERFDLILTVSEYSRQAILEFAQRHRLRCPPVVNASEGVDEPLIDTSASVKGDYVLHLASKLPHKGTAWLLQTWRKLQQTAGATLPELVLVGEIDAAARPTLSALKNVKFHGPAPRADLERMMAGARALILPSEIEGFGLPAVEAYFCGTPTAFVRGTAVEEVLGAETPGGFELTPEPDSFLLALRELLALDSTLCQAKATELRQRYSWDLCVDKTLAAYRSVL